MRLLVLMIIGLSVFCQSQKLYETNGGSFKIGYPIDFDDKSITILTTDSLVLDFP